MTQAAFHGPTWQRGDDGRFVLPEHTLGWEVLQWMSTHLLQPDGENAGQPFVPTNEQARFVLHWYEVDDQGRFIHSSGFLRRMKGWGKDPIAAAICLVEFVGPCRFSHWNSSGEPVAKGVPGAWVQVAAVTQEQSRNTFSLFPLMMSPGLIARWGIDTGQFRLLAEGGSRRLEAVTSNARALEGARSSFVLSSEVQHWLSTNGGHAMSAVIDRNLTKARGASARNLAIANAHAPGEDSVGERTWDAYVKMQEGKTKAEGLLYDSLEADPSTDLSDEDSLRQGILQARGDSDWLDVDRIIQATWDPRTSPSEARRYYLNQISAADDAWVAPHEWDANAVEDSLSPGDRIALFFDGSRTDDHTGLVACRIEDGFVTVLGHWNPERHGGEIPRLEVDAAVHRAFDQYEVEAFFADVKDFETYIDSWHSTYGDDLRTWAHKDHSIAFDMRHRKREFTEMAERALTAITDGSFPHDNSVVLGQHIKNARRRTNRYGISFGKESRESSRKVDLAVCAVGARGARDRVASGTTEKSRKKKPSTTLMGV